MRASRCASSCAGRRKESVWQDWLAGQSRVCLCRGMPLAVASCDPLASACVPVTRLVW